MINPPNTVSQVDLALIEKIARAMALADGFDPDEFTSGGPNRFQLQAKNFNGHGLCQHGPVWETYRRDANLFLAAQCAFLGPDLYD